MSEHDIDTCPTCRAVLYGEGVIPEMLPELKGISPVKSAIWYQTTTPATGSVFGRLLKHAFAQAEKDGPPWVHTFTFPEEDEPDCRHHGGTEDCPFSCLNIYGDTFHTIRDD